MSKRKLYVGAQNDGLFIIDKPPRPVPVDYITEGGDTNVIAVMSGSGREDQKLAHLFAAAPDLKAFTERFYKWFDMSGAAISARWDRIPPEERMALVKDAAAALARARGEEQ